MSGHRPMGDHPWPWGIESTRLKEPIGEGHADFGQRVNVSYMWASAVYQNKVGMTKGRQLVVDTRAQVSTSVPQCMNTPQELVKHGYVQSDWL